MSVTSWLRGLARPSHSSVARSDTRGTSRQGETDRCICVHCNGSGVVTAGQSSEPGQPRYDTCPVCEGKRRVPAEKHLYTTNGQRSVEIARQLMLAYGQPAGIRVEASQTAELYDAWIVFPDGCEYRLGGFRLGTDGEPTGSLASLVAASGDAQVTGPAAGPASDDYAVTAISVGTAVA